MYLAANGHSVIIRWNPNEDHLLIESVLFRGLVCKNKCVAPSLLFSHLALSFFSVLHFSPLYFLAALVSFPSLFRFFFLVCSLSTGPQGRGDELITFCITGPSCHAGAVCLCLCVRVCVFVCVWEKDARNTCKCRSTLEQCNFFTLRSVWRQYLMMGCIHRF